MAKWKKGYQQEPIIEEIEKTRRTNNDGSVSFDSWSGKIVHETVLYSMLDISTEITESEGRRLVRNAVKNVGKRGSITQEKLRREVSKLEASYLKKTTQRFSLVTSISLYQFTKLNMIYVDSTRILFPIYMPRKFVKAANEIIKTVGESLYAPRPTNYLPVQVNVTAKTNFQAVDIALTELDFIRGIWNFNVNRGHRSRWSLSAKQDPVNKIILGPIHTIHYSSGKAASGNIYWYERNYLGKIKVHRIKDQSKFEDSTKNIRALIKKSADPEKVKTSLIRYSRALDERNFNTAFINLWGILELLTDTVYKSHEVTIKRLAFLYEDYEVATEILRHLKEFRNRTVHAAAENSELESYLYQLKMFVEGILSFIIGNKFGFKSMEDVGEFLSLPKTKEGLVSRMNKTQNAMKFKRYM